MADQGLLDRPAESPAPPLPGPSRADGNPRSNAPGEYLAFAAPPAAADTAAAVAQAQREIAAAQEAVAAARAALAADGALETADLADDWNPTGWIIAAGGGIAALYAWHKLDQAQKAKAKAEAKLKELEKAKSKPDTNVQVKDAPCLVDEYKNLKKICGGEAHHIMPDMVYRLGARPTTEAAMNSTADRIPNAPTFNQGMAICLTDAQHAGLHGSLKGTLDGLGAAQSPSGTAPMGKITTAAAGSILAIPGLPAKCKALAISKLTGQIASKGLGANQPGRTQQAPLPSGQAATVLRQGHY